jgi:cytidylate kinase
MTTAWVEEAGTAPVLTVSATYGAGGSVVAPEVADRLGLPLVDRLVSPDLAHGAVASGEALSEAEERATPGNRFFSYLARAAPFGATIVPPLVDVDDDEVVRRRAEAPIAELRNGRGGVVLGRAAAVVLGDSPGTYHVRLDGPPERRAQKAALIEGIPLERAQERLTETDRARAAYVRRLYHADPSDRTLYHLLVDTTVMELAHVVELVVVAARGALHFG